MVSGWIDDCVILSWRDYGEKTRIIDVFTRQYGKVTGVLNNFRRFNISVCDIAEIEYRSKKAGSMGYIYIKSSQSLWIHMVARKNHLLVCQAICNDINNNIGHNVRYADVFDMATDVIRRMYEYGEKEVINLYCYFCIRLLYLLGYGFDDKCHSCKATAEFIEYDGRSLCSSCRRGEKCFCIPNSWKYWSVGDMKSFADHDLKVTFAIIEHFFTNNFSAKKNTFRNILFDTIM